MQPTTRSLLVLASAAVGLAACGSDRVNAPDDTPAKLRIVNSAFQYTDATNTAANTVARAIDVLVDSATTSPGATSIPPVSVLGASPDGTGYVTLPASIHSFVARLAGQTSQSSQLYTNTTNNQPYLPKQYLAPQMPYTLIVAGIAPVTAPPGTPQQATPSTAFPFAAIVGDPFPPQKIDGAYQARFRVINAAPFATASGAGATILAYLTPGSTPPATTAGLTALGGALYRNGSAYFNVAPGEDVLTIAAGTTILAQIPVTFAAGEVRSFILQSTGYASSPGVGNHRVTAVVDAKF
jgi:hypothetical protein